MSIISPIGRRHPRTRLLRGGILLVLIAGAVTMVYPFLLMLAGSTRSAVDQRESDILPDFLFQDAALYRKHLEALFNEELSALETAYDTDATSFARLDPPAEPNRALVDAWHRFLDKTAPPPDTYSLGYVRTPISRTQPLLLRRFKARLKDRFAGSLPRLNRDLLTEFVNWNAFYVIPADTLSRRRTPTDTPFREAWREFKQTRPGAYRVHFMVEGHYKTLFLRTQYGTIEQYNRTHGTGHDAYDDIRLTRRAPAAPATVRADWEQFVRHTLHLRWIRMDDAATPQYHAFLRARYDRIGTYNHRRGTDHAAFSAIPLPQRAPAAGIPRSDWRAFLQGWQDPDSGTLHLPPLDTLSLDTLEFRFADFLKAQYPSLPAANRALDTAADRWSDLRPPLRDAHALAFRTMTGELRREFLLRNYLAVFDYLLLHGRGIVNTLIYCALAVLAALLVNPLAAYALSRFRLRHTYHLLLLMLITMAFPPMVTQIPLFLLLRDLNLLNTFAALVLPGLAHGYSIFLLKGFFDSLPRELYESAQIDGAGEWTMFWRITMSLSKPILAVVALQAFTIAYSNFMFALLLCQDQSMWTLMVWLYELQQRSGTGVLYASLVISAILPLIIFLFCQNIIMRGIVVPVEK